MLHMFGLPIRASLSNNSHQDVLVVMPNMLLGSTFATTTALLALSSHVMLCAFKEF